MKFRTDQVFFAFISIGLLLASSPGKSESPPVAAPEKIEIAFFESPPLAHITHSGGLSGRVIETVREICHKAQLGCELKMLPVARVYRSIAQGTVPVIIAAQHPSMGDCCLASQWQYPWSAGIYSKALPEHIPETEEQLKYRKMIVIRGWQSPYAYFKNLKTLSEQGIIKLPLAQDNSSAVRMLKYDRAQYLWGGSHFNWHLEKNGIANQFNYKPLISSPLAFWVDSNRPDILLKLNRGYQLLKAEGSLTEDGSELKPEIMQQYYQDAARF